MVHTYSYPILVTICCLFLRHTMVRAAIYLCQFSSAIAEINIKTESHENQSHPHPLSVEQ